MASPKVSVIIPTYNQSKYIGACIRSVLDQTFTDYEILIINNHSTDNTLEVINSFKDPRINIEKIDNQGRVAKSRNLGISLARGEYIAFLDSDDLWLPEKLARSIDKFADEKVGIVYTAKNNIDSNGNPVKIFLEDKIDTPEGDVFENLLWNSFTVPSALVVRKSVIDDVGDFSLEYSIIEDYEWFLRVAKRYHFEVVNEPLLKYRVHSESNSQKLEFKGEELVKLFNDLQENLSDLSDMGSGGIKRHLAFGNSLIGRAKALEGNTKAASTYFIKSLKLFFNYKNVVLFIASCFGKEAFKFIYKTTYRNIT